MSSLYSKLSVLKDDENFFLNSRTNKTVKEIQKELNITIDEAMVLSIIMSYQIQDTYSTSFDSLKKDFKLQSDEYLKYLNIAYKTKGSVHTIEQDITDLMKQGKDKKFNINGVDYIIKNGSIKVF